MRVPGKWVAVVLVALAVGVPARGTVLVSETFTHPNGNLVGTTPEIGGNWAAHSGAGSLSVQVSSGAAVLAQGSGSREDVNAPFDGGFAASAGTVLYSGFDLTVPDPEGSITDTYFAMFLEGSTLFDGRIWITDPTTSGFRLAISNDNSITDADGEVFTGDLSFGQTYRVVTKYDYDAGAAMLWIDPVNEASSSISATDPGFSDEVIAYAFRQAGGNTTQTIDNLAVGMSFSEALSIPEPTSVALLGLALLALPRRRRAG